MTPGRDNPTPLDPAAAIMAAHEDHVWPNTRGCLYADMDRDKPETQRCVPHRLAAALAAAQERAEQADERAEQAEENAQRESERYIAMRADRDRLAAALAAAQERERRVEALLDSEYVHVHDGDLAIEFMPDCAGCWDRDIRAVLADVAIESRKCGARSGPYSCTRPPHPPDKTHEDDAGHFWPGHCVCEFAGAAACDAHPGNNPHRAALAGEGA